MKKLSIYAILYKELIKEIDILVDMNEIKNILAQRSWRGKARTRPTPVVNSQTVNKAYLDQDCKVCEAEPEPVYLKYLLRNVPRRAKLEFKILISFWLKAVLFYFLLLGFGMHLDKIQPEVLYLSGMLLYSATRSECLIEDNRGGYRWF